ncbi:palmitoyltransferase [Coemansia erecta]|uniref:Synaptobrevin homolog YKT6 n=1 Tax=Coemansia erecta TaxID=147472 RepID=A0A9W8CUD5_9FUNG|nr:palmitoyltransferase [Coemansia erecta]
MKVFNLAVIRVTDERDAQGQRQPSTIVCSASDLSSFSFFQRGSVAEFMDFMSTTVAERTAVGQRQAVSDKEHGEHVVYAYRAPGNLCATVLTDKEYPDRVALSLASRLLDEVQKEFPAEKLRTTSTRLESTVAAEFIGKYQDPKQADSIMKVQQELEETKAVLHKTIEGILERGTKLESLVDRSNQLSSSSKAFYKTAQKTNSCCVVM